MARNRSFSVNPMTDGNVLVGTDIRQKIFGVDFIKAKIEDYAVWLLFNGDNAQWRLDNPGMDDPKDNHCAAVNPDAPTVKEQLFVEVRMQTVDSATGQIAKENSDWRQVSIVNYPSLNTGPYWARLKHIHDTEVTRAGLDPV